ncbi:MAG: hypothetical protein IBJ13_04445 [Sphingopyxis sp.]|nr:hypothetical protein [Sphingopyxis sp.]
MILSALVGFPASAQTVEERARTAAAASRAKSSDSDAILENYLTPGLSAAPIATVDGTRRFTPNLACQASASLLEILVQPGSGGDLAHVRIARDRDLDGSLDQVSTLPVPVSGICANGIIACTPGTWERCRTFQWSVGVSGALELDEVDMPALAGCYCINNSCGANLAIGNLATVLKDLGGGAIGALTTHDPRIAVAEARVNGPLIQYVGTQTTACASAPGVAQTGYRANPGALVGDAFAAAASSSLFKSLAASPAGTGRAEEVRACTIRRDILTTPTSFDDIVTASGQLAGVTSCGTDCRRYRIGGDGNCNAVPPIYTATFSVARPARVVSARIVRLDANDWLQARVNGGVVGYAGRRPWLGDALPPGDCNVDEEPINASPIDVTEQFRSGRAAVGARVRGGGDNRWGWIDLEVRVDTSCERIEQLVDLCSGISVNPRCRLTEEEVDGVFTFRGGVGTGLRPLPQTRPFGTGACLITLTRDFFVRSRRYNCVVDTGAMPEPDLSRGAYIIDRSTETMLADRVRTADGGAAASTRPFALPDRGSVPACEAICKTRAPKPNSDAAPDGVVGARQVSPTGWDHFYHACTLDGAGASVCPAGPGEDIVSPCGCLDDFPEAVVMMQAVRLAGADLACTASAR